MVEEAEKYAAEDKERMERIEARNGLESYLYNVRNSLNEEKVKDKLGEDAERGSALVQEGLDWLAANESATTDEFKEKQKVYEEQLRSIMMKLYGGDNGSGEASGEAADAPGPKVEEVD